MDMAKVVLDELKGRLRLVDELRRKTSTTDTLEVQELQPLFYQGLWIFGPEFETIEFTSNEGMTSVVQKLFHRDIKGSRNRPDFVVLPDGSVGFYAYPKYDDHGAEMGVDRLSTASSRAGPVADTSVVVLRNATLLRYGDPTSVSVPPMLGIMPRAGTELRIQWHQPDGQRWTLQSRTALGSGVWTSVALEPTDLGEDMRAVDIAPQGGGELFRLWDGEVDP